MDFNSQEWKDECRSKSFVPASVEAGLVEETVRRISEILDTSANSQTLTEIITVALFDAQDMIINRMDS